MVGRIARRSAICAAFGLAFVVIAVPALDLTAAAKNLALGRPYTVNPIPNYPLTVSGTDTIKLTDGSYTNGYFWTDPKRTTAGWENTGPIQVEIDLGSALDINGVTVDTARNVGAGVSFPRQVEVFVSPDKVNYAYIGDVMWGQGHGDGSYLVKKFTLGGLSCSGRYVRLILQPKGSYLFVDEIEVTGSGSNTLSASGSYPLKSADVTALNAQLVQWQCRAAALTTAANSLLTLATDLARSDTYFASIRDGLNQALVGLKAPITDAGPLQTAESILLELHRRMLQRRFAQPLVVWAKNPWAVFTPFDSPAPGMVVSGMSMDVMKNGTASDAFILSNNSIQTKTVSVSTDSAAVWLREVMPVLVADDTLRGDALNELVQDQVTIRPGESKQVWVTVPGSASPGPVSASITLADAAGGPAIKVPLSIKIWPVQMPQAQTARVDAWSYLNGRMISNMKSGAVQDLLAHHVNVFVMAETEIPWPSNSGTGPVTNFTSFDSWVNLTKGANKRIFYFGFNNPQYRTFQNRYDFMSSSWQSWLKTWIRAWVTHMKSLGMEYDSFAFYPFDEPQNPADAIILAQTAALIKTVDPNLRVFTTVDDFTRLNSTVLSSLGNAVDIFQVGVSDAAKFRAFYGNKKEIWTYGSGNKISDPMAVYRIRYWQTFRDGATGSGVWAYADNGSSGTAWNDLDGTRPDYAVIYEGSSTNAIASSKRWEAWREGVEDYELLSIAASKLSQAEAGQFQTQISQIIGNPQNYTQFQTIRRALLGIGSR
jgi:hypothetical protein